MCPWVRERPLQWELRTQDPVGQGEWRREVQSWTDSEPRELELEDHSWFPSKTPKGLYEHLHMIVSFRTMKTEVVLSTIG